MAVGKFMKSSGMAALAAGLALLTLPVSAIAQEHGHGRWGGGGGGDSAQSGGGGDAGSQGGGWRGRGGDGGGSQGGGWRGHGGDGGGWQGNGGSGGFRSEQSMPAPAPQVQAPPQHNWSRGEGNGGGRWNGNGDNGGARWNGGRWRGRDNVQTEPAPAPQVVTPRHEWSQGGSRWQGDGQWQGRNRSYVDPNRNGGYRDPNRDAYRGRDDVGRWRNGEGNRWRGDNDNRWRGNDAYRWRGDRQGFSGDYRNWNRDWRGDRRYDWRSYRDANRYVYRLSPYYSPYRNYSYRRLGIGFYLDTLFFSSRYWIDDPWYYRLPPAYGPYRWVRYYDDALLVNIYTGEVVDVIYDFFW